ncbi:unnamed protein product [Colias eurytheme]|nr:unnamed protein product [Colias eurytheme]
MNKVNSHRASSLEAFSAQSSSIHVDAADESYGTRVFLGIGKSRAAIASSGSRTLWARLMTNVANKYGLEGTQRDKTYLKVGDRKSTVNIMFYLYGISMNIDGAYPHPQGGPLRLRGEDTFMWITRAHHV